jgi:hypothetical protein
MLNPALTPIPKPNHLSAGPFKIKVTLEVVLSRVKFAVIPLFGDKGTSPVVFCCEKPKKPVSKREKSTMFFIF